MKNFFKVLTLGLFLAVFAAVNVAPTFAQDPEAEKQAIYKRYTDNYAANTIEGKQLAIDAAKEYIQKYENSGPDKQIVDYLKGAIPKLQEWIETEKKRQADLEKEKQRQARLAKYQAAYKAKNWDQLFVAGADILKYEPEFLDLTLELAAVGYEQSFASQTANKFNEYAVQYAKKSIDKMKSGKTSETYAGYKNKDYADGKSNALGWMNYMVGSIKYFKQNKEQEALPYLYKATQYNSATKKLPEVYRAIGRWYLNKVIEMEKVRDDKVKANEGEDTDETKSLLAQNKGYAARAIDAYSRAYSLAKANPKTPAAYKDNLFKNIKQLYDFRYDADEAAMKTEAKINSDVALVMNKPMPNPTSPVDPIEKPKPAVESTDSTDAATNGGAKRARTVSSKTNKPRNR